MSLKGESLRWHPARANLKPMPETGKPEQRWTEAELAEFDQQAHENFERKLREEQAQLLEQKARDLRAAWLPEPDDPKPGTEEAKEAIRDAIKQGAE